jgi:hypothetical protein
MTTYPAPAAQAMPHHGRLARREIAIHRSERITTAAPIHIPPIVVTLGIALIALAAYSLVLVLIDLM